MPDPAPTPPTERPQGPGGDKPPMIPRNRGFVTFLVLLLVINLVLSFATGGPASRTRVPYQPFFVNQLSANNVQQITSRAASIEGELKKEANYDPPGDAKPVKVTKFKTEIPAFIDPASLTKTLSDANVVVNANPPDAGRSLISTRPLFSSMARVFCGSGAWARLVDARARRASARLMTRRITNGSSC